MCPAQAIVRNCAVRTVLGSLIMGFDPVGKVGAHRDPVIEIRAVALGSADRWSTSLILAYQILT